MRESAHNDLVVPPVRERTASGKVLLLAESPIFAAYPGTVVIDQGQSLAVVAQDDVARVEVVDVVADRAGAPRADALVQQVEHAQEGGKDGVIDSARYNGMCLALMRQGVPHGAARQFDSQHEGQHGTGGEGQVALVQALGVV
eukprot:UN2507